MLREFFRNDEHFIARVTGFTRSMTDVRNPGSGLFDVAGNFLCRGPLLLDGGGDGSRRVIELDDGYNNPLDRIVGFVLDA